jgi:DNA-binding LacI/PurR family transcriptional regulator
LPTAFFCVNDYMAIGAIEQLKTYKVKVPEDISIIGMDDMEFSSEIEPRLTTVRIKMEKLGEVGIKKIIKLINENYEGSLKTIIDNEIIIRDSCRKL